MARGRSASRRRTRHHRRPDCPAPALPMAVGRWNPVSMSSHQPDARQREVMNLCQKVEWLFRKMWPKAKRHPSVTACYSVAIRINIVKITPRLKKSAPPTALKHGRLLLQHLPTIQQPWEVASQMYKMDTDDGEIVVDQSGLDNCLAVLGTIKQTEQCVRAFLQACTPARQVTPNGAAFIADAVRRTWGSIPGAKVPRSARPDDPLCRFVTEAMALVGKNLSAATVSDMLRDRRQRRKKSKRAKVQ